MPYALPEQAARLIHTAYLDYQASFQAITGRAALRFAQADWHGVQADAVARLELYRQVVNTTVGSIQALLGSQVKTHSVWVAMKSIYAQLISCCNDFELAETFFNSITRRIFSTVGVDPEIEFVDSDFNPRPPADPEPIFRTYPIAPPADDAMQPLAGVLTATFSTILDDHPYPCGYAQPAEACAAAGPAALAQLIQTGLEPDLHLVRIEVLRQVFYRNFGAYIIGRLVFARPDGTELLRPLALCLRNPGQGIVLDAVLTDEDEVSIVFSFARSYFHLQTEQPHAVVRFLKSIMPLKRLAELYIAIGYNKHGKTELYRDLRRQLSQSSDQFQIAPGDKGMVMAVFTLPSHDLVFKVIKDRILPPKTTTRQEVMARYDLVFKHDKAGRLVDAQEFEHLTFERARFADDLLAELSAVAPQTVQIGPDTVSIAHLYTERRLTPLNLYIKEATPAQAVAAVIDYGQTIKDLALTNIFPGDVLLKNFGVTRHGRVVFYDYDELCHVSECKFRPMPKPRNDSDEYESEPFFYVGPLDIFPEEFLTFLGLQGELRQLFIEKHGQIFDFRWWRSMQQRHKQGELVDIVAYPAARRLRTGA